MQEENDKSGLEKPEQTSDSSNGTNVTESQDGPEETSDSSDGTSITKDQGGPKVTSDSSNGTHKTLSKQNQENTKLEE